jgi:hypothetical protein
MTLTWANVGRTPAISKASINDSVFINRIGVNGKDGAGKLPCFIRGKNAKKWRLHRGQQGQLVMINAHEIIKNSHLMAREPLRIFFENLSLAMPIIMGF